LLAILKNLGHLKKILGDARVEEVIDDFMLVVILVLVVMTKLWEREGEVGLPNYNLVEHGGKVIDSSVTAADLLSVTSTKEGITTLFFLADLGGMFSVLAVISLISSAEMSVSSEPMVKSSLSSSS
jgi:hypothetical protein